jgi:hypothetical protein
MMLIGWVRVPHVRAPDGSFEPAVMALAIVVALAIGWVVWEFYFRDKRKN